MRSTERRFAMALATTLGLVACGGSEPVPAVATPAASASRAQATIEPAKVPKSAAAAQPLDSKLKPDMPPPGSSLARVMHAHFKDALLIRQAVIAGTPEQAAEAARVLALSENLDDQPPGWRDFVERMQQAAKRIADGATMARAAAAASDIGVACGQCHEQQGGPAVSSEPPPLEGTTLEQRMKRHAWATERLWEGIVVPSSQAWKAGATALVDTPFPDAVLRRSVGARRAASDFKAVVAQASTKRTLEEHAALYAGLLTTCGSCHAANHSGP